jgi:MraZ protein
MPESEKTPILYSSSYSHGVDEKRRVQIPSKWRGEEKEVTFTLIVWKKASQEACLLALPPEVMKTLMAKIAAMPFSDPRAEALRRLLGTKSDQVTTDKAGRICLPEAMAREAGIDKQAVLVGMWDRFQIWDPVRYAPTRDLDEALTNDAMSLI